MYVSLKGDYVKKYKRFFLNNWIFIFARIYRTHGLISPRIYYVVNIKLYIKIFLINIYYLAKSIYIFDLYKKICIIRNKKNSTVLKLYRVKMSVWKIT